MMTIVLGSYLISENGGLPPNVVVSILQCSVEAVKAIRSNRSVLDGANVPDMCSHGDAIRRNHCRRTSSKKRLKAPSHALSRLTACRCNLSPHFSFNEIRGQ